MELTIGILVVIALFIVCLTVIICRTLRLGSDLAQHRANLDHEVDLAEIAAGNSTYEDPNRDLHSYLYIKEEPVKETPKVESPTTQTEKAPYPLAKDLDLDPDLSPNPEA